jgi:hypothetical protein
VEGQPVLGADLNCSESRCCVALPHLGRWPIGVKAERLAVSIFRLRPRADIVATFLALPKMPKPTLRRFRVAADLDTLLGRAKG